MRFLVIGLGSMGKRRIRNLLANNQNNIVGVDVREDRRREAEDKYGIKTYKSIEGMDIFDKIDAVIISVPPDKHMEYAHMAFDSGKHCFIEASVVDKGMKGLLEKSIRNSKVKICPSCTLRFHPSIMLIKEIVESGKLGKLSNFSYHSGQYLHDWHPWEGIRDYYVSRRETGGCREIVPFELTWLNWVFGDISGINGFVGKTIELGADIDDVYSVLLRYKSGLIGTLLVDVVSRYAVRRLVVNGEKGQVLWDWNKNCVEVYLAEDGSWEYYKEPEGTSEKGYNQNIIEEMYIKEIKCFIDAIQGKDKYPNTLEDDYRILKYLYGIEKANETGKSIIF